MVYLSKSQVLSKLYGFSQGFMRFLPSFSYGFQVGFHVSTKNMKSYSKVILSLGSMFTSPLQSPLQTRFGNPAKSPKMHENTRKCTKNTWFLHPKAIMSEIKCRKRAKKMNSRFVGRISQKDPQKSLIFHQFSVFFVENSSFRDPISDQRQ